jgi:hypothetical protein
MCRFVEFFEDGRWKKEDGRWKTSPEVLEGSGHLISLASRTSADDFSPLRRSLSQAEVFSKGTLIGIPWLREPQPAVKLSASY